MPIKDEIRKSTEGMQCRQLNADIKQTDDDNSIRMTFSTDAPHEQRWGVEILDHNPDSVMLDRLNNTGHLTIDHSNSIRDVIGRVTSAVVTGNKGRAVVELSPRSDLAPIVNDIKSGLLANVSVRYRIHDMEFEQNDKGEEAYRVTKWEPYHLSMVVEPADVNSQVNRSIEVKNMPEETHNDVANNGTASVGQVPVANNGMVAAEASRDEQIMRLAEYVSQRAPDSGIMELANDAIMFGHRFEDFRAKAWEIMQRSQESKPKPAIPSEIGMSTQEIQQYSLFRAIRATMKGGSWDNAPLELEASRAITERIGKPPRGFYVPFEVQRALDTGTPGGAAELVGTDHRGDLFIEMLRTRSVVIGQGAIGLTGLVGNVDIPKQSDAATFYWIDEGADTTLSDQTTAVVTLSPKTISGGTAMTRRLLLQSDPSVEQMVREDLMRGAALAIDLASVQGSGAAGQPRGVVNDPDVNAVTLAAPGSPTWAELVSFETAIDSSDGLGDSMAHVCTPAVLGNLKTAQKDAGSGMFLYEGGLANGYPVRRRTGLAANTLVLGDWRQVIVGFWGVMDVKPDEAALAASGGLVLRVFQDVDIGVRHGQAFAVGNLI